MDDYKGPDLFPFSHAVDAAYSGDLETDFVLDFLFGQAFVHAPKDDYQIALPANLMGGVLEFVLVEVSGDSAVVVYRVQVQPGAVANYGGTSVKYLEINEGLLERPPC